MKSNLPWKITFKSNFTFIFSYAFHFLHNLSQCCSYVRPFNYPVQIALFCLPDIQYSVTLFAFPLLLLKLLKWILLLSVNFHSQDHRRDGEGPGLSKENCIFAHPHSSHTHTPLASAFCLYSCLVSSIIRWITTNPVTVTTFRTWTGTSSDCVSIFSELSSYCNNLK